MNPVGVTSDLIEASVNSAYQLKANARYLYNNPGAIKDELIAPWKNFQNASIVEKAGMTGKLAGNAFTFFAGGTVTKGLSLERQLSGITNNIASRNKFFNNQNVNTKIRITGAYYQENSSKVFVLDLGKLSDSQVRITLKGLKLVENHLTQFGSILENNLMISRLRNAMENNLKLTGADASFYIHEITEATKMSKFNMEYIQAHNFALDKYKVSPYSVYHPDVISQANKLEPGSFNEKWVSFWDNLNENRLSKKP